MKAIDKNWYDYSYFVTASKPFREQTGELNTFGYLGSNLIFFQSLVNYLQTHGVKYVSCLDVGAGIGDMIVANRNIGVNCEGVEYSPFIFTPLDQLKSQLKLEDYMVIANARPYMHQCDATKLPFPDKTFDIVTLIDVCEHIYEEDIPLVINEVKRSAKKWILTKTCTARGAYEEIFLKRGEKVPLEFEWLGVAGHVSSQTPDWWNSRWVDHEWRMEAEWAERFKLEMHLPDDWRGTMLYVRQ